MSEQARDMVNTIIEVYIPEFQKNCSSISI